MIGALNYSNLAKEIQTRIYSRVLAGQSVSYRLREIEIPTHEHTTYALLVSPPPYSYSTPLPLSSSPPSAWPLLSPSANGDMHYGSPSTEVVETLKRMECDFSVVANIQTQIVEALVSLTTVHGFR